MQGSVILNCPSEIAKILQDLSNIYADDCNTIVLYGSSSHNGLVYTKSNGILEFLSDIEFIVIPKDPNNENNKAFRKLLTDKTSKYFLGNSSVGRAPFVDVNPVSLRFFLEAQPRISTFELKANGIVIKGDNVLDLLPDVCADNYEAKIQNIEVVKGLKVLLIESNKWFLCHDSYTDNERNEFCYFLSSCFLNVLRTLLPQFGIFKSTVMERVSQLEVIRTHEEFRKYFAEGIIEEFESIYKQKTEGNFLYSPQKLFNVTFRTYKSLLAFLLKLRSEEDLIPKIEKSKNLIFWGDNYKIDLLSQLTRFFLSALTCLNQLIDSRSAREEDMNKMLRFYDELIYGEKSYTVMNIINDYTRLERDRWNIIGSKD